MEQEKSKQNIAAFLHRVTFIANIFFIVCLGIRYTDSQTAQSVTGTVIILGWLMPPFLYIISMIVFLMNRKKYVPVWLIVINTLFFTFQVLYFFLT